MGYRSGWEGRVRLGCAPGAFWRPVGDLIANSAGKPALGPISRHREA